MKRILIVLFLAAFFSTLNAQPIDWDAVIDRYVEKYQPQEIPAWLFPIIFKDATGAMDTIYYGYDEEASFAYPVDTIFSETFVLADSSQFNAYWAKCPPSLCDSLKILDINMVGGGFVSASYTINFRNGLLPVTMYFDATFLSDDVLPLPDQSPNPRAQINIKNGWPMSAWSDPDHTFPCDYNEPLLITDNSLMGELCVFSDSIEFIADPDIIDWIAGFFFDLLPWTGLNPVSNKELENIIAPKIYPNPSNDFLNIKFSQPTNTGTWKIHDMMGRLIGYEKFQFQETIFINISQYDPGIYFLYVKNNHQTSIHKFVIENL